MIIRIIDPAVIRVDDPLCSSLFLSQCIYIALLVVSVRKESFIISEIIAAYALPRCIRLQRASIPSQLFSLFLGDKVGWQLSIRVYIQCYILFGRIASVFINIRQFLFRACLRRFRRIRNFLSGILLCFLLSRLVFLCDRLQKPVDDAQLAELGIAVIGR